jgi:hypothetical protein
MPRNVITFANEGREATTVDHDDKDSEGYDSKSQGTDNRSKVSASRYEGDVADIPTRILFMELESSEEAFTGVSHVRTPRRNAT